MERKRKNLLGKLILCIGEIIVGTLLLINPIGFTTGIIITFGVLLVVMGAISIVKYFRSTPQEALLGQGLAKGICITLLGLFCIFSSAWFINTFPILTIVYGVITLITGVVRTEWAVDMLRLKVQRWYFAAISAVISIVCAIIILLNPFETTMVIWTFIAISLIVEAVVDLVVMFLTGTMKESE